MDQKIDLKQNLSLGGLNRITWILHFINDLFPFTCLLISALMFMYLLFKVGIFQCIGRSLCKMGWAACETYWYALEDISCFLWHKLKNTKRVNHRKRFQDVEVGYSSSEESDSSLDNYRKRKSYGERRYDKGYSHRHRHVRLKTREVSVHVKGGSRRGRKSRRVQRRKGSNCRRDTSLFKRQRLQ